MLASECPMHSIENLLKSASFFVIMHLHEGLTHIQSQIKPRLLFGESFTLIKEPRKGRDLLMFIFVFGFYKTHSVHLNSTEWKCQI